MRKVWVIASREYQAAVRTKAFVFSIVMMPVLWGASIGLQVLMKKAEDQTTKKVLVVDRTPGQEMPGGEATGVEKIPIPRQGTVDECTPLVVFLASERASYITGQTYHVNGGAYFG